VCGGSFNGKAKNARLQQTRPVPPRPPSAHVQARPRRAAAQADRRFGGAEVFVGIGTSDSLDSRTRRTNKMAEGGPSSGATLGLVSLRRC